MKKVGIITIVNVNNYGAELQAFATFRKLQLMGYNAEIINYLYYKDWRYIDSKMSRSFNSMSIKRQNYLLCKISGRIFRIK